MGQLLLIDLGVLSVTNRVAHGNDLDNVINQFATFMNIKANF